ncbi:MAG: hypothetical protein AAGJ28_06605 [Pseudomonadota bacterium]
MRLSLKGLTFTAAICSEANSAGTGSAVSGLRFVNLDHMLWVEAHPDRKVISLQLDPDRWLLLRFRKKGDFAKALGQVEAA